MAYKKISEFPVVEAIGVHIFGRTNENKNVQVLLDIQQSIGNSTESLMSQDAITKAIDNKKGSNIQIGTQIVSNDKVIVEKTASIGEALQTVVTELNQIGVSALTGLESPNDTINIGVDVTTDKTTLDVNLTGIINPNKGLEVDNNSIGIKIENSERNILTLSSSGGLLVESENYWQQID